MCVYVSLCLVHLRAYTRYFYITCALAHCYWLQSYELFPIERKKSELFYVFNCILFVWSLFLFLWRGK